MRSNKPRRTAFAAALAAAALLGACSDNNGPDDHEEPAVTSMVIDVNGVDHTVTLAGGGFTPATATLDGTTAELVATFLDASGEPDPAVLEHADDFELSVAGNASGGALPAGVSFTRSAPFEGTLTLPAGESVTIFFGLYHTGEEHDDFGPYPLQIAAPGAAATAQ